MDTGVPDHSQAGPDGVRASNGPPQKPPQAVSTVLASASLHGPRVSDGSPPVSRPVASPESITPPLPPPPAATLGATAAVQRPKGPNRSRGAGDDRRTKDLLGILLVALLVLPAVGAALWSNLQPPTYAAEVDLLHAPSDTSSSDSIERQLATHEVLLLRRSLLDAAAQSVGRDPDELAENVGVEIVEGSSVLRLQVVDEDSERAERTATFLADQYVSVAEELAPSSNIGPVRIISAPTVLDEPVGPQPLRAAAAGALLGLVLVLVFVATLRLRHKRSRHSAL